MIPSSKSPSVKITEAEKGGGGVHPFIISLEQGWNLCLCTSKFFYSAKAGLCFWLWDAFNTSWQLSIGTLNLPNEP